MVVIVASEDTRERVARAIVGVDGVAWPPADAAVAEWALRRAEAVLAVVSPSPDTRKALERIREQAALEADDTPSGLVFSSIANEAEAALGRGRSLTDVRAAAPPVGVARSLALTALDALRWTRSTELRADGWGAMEAVLMAAAKGASSGEDGLLRRLLEAGWNVCPAADQETPVWLAPPVGGGERFTRSDVEMIVNLCKAGRELSDAITELRETGALPFVAPPVGVDEDPRRGVTDLEVDTAMSVDRVGQEHRAVCGLCVWVGPWRRASRSAVRDGDEHSCFALAWTCQHRACQKVLAAAPSEGSKQ